MSDDAGAKLLAAVEAMHADVLAVLAEARAEHAASKAERDATETLRDQRAKKAARQKEWRSGTTASKRSVSGDATRSVSVASTPVVVDLDPKQREQDQKQLPPERRHKDATAVASTGPQPGPTTPVWNAYAAAYEQRHGCEPADGKAERGKLMRFIEKVPKAEAAEIAAFFLTHNDSLYIRAKHPIDLLLRDAQKLRTEWKTGRRSTGTAAREQDKTQANLDGWAEHMSPEGRNALVGK